VGVVLRGEGRRTAVPDKTIKNSLNNFYVQANQVDIR
jgi:hypothetical protein